jgi:integrase
MNFWLAEGYMKDPVKVEMPRVGKKRLLSLSGDEVTKILTKCSKREKAIILLMVDTGLRRAEVCTLNWGDVDMGSGLCKVKQGKGNKDRSTVIGASARRALLAYKRTLERAESKDPVIQTDEGGRFAGSGLYRLFKRLEKRVGMSITPHSLRRSFVTLSLRAGMNPLHLQTMLGHASLEMVQHYAQMIDDDILQAHEDYSPADRL